MENIGGHNGKVVVNADAVLGVQEDIRGGSAVRLVVFGVLVGAEIKVYDGFAGSGLGRGAYLQEHTGVFIQNTNRRIDGVGITV